MLIPDSPRQDGIEWNVAEKACRREKKSGCNVGDLSRRGRVRFGRAAYVDPDDVALDGRSRELAGTEPASWSALPMLAEARGV